MSLIGRHGFSWCVSAMALTACGAPAVHNPARPSETARGHRLAASQVTGAVLSALDAEGRFVFSVVPWRSTSPQRADSVAIAAARFTGRMRPAAFDSIWGAPIDFSALRPCARKYRVLAVAEPLPLHVYRPVRLEFGPRWVVPLCLPSGDSPVSVEVADGESALELSPDGGFAGSFFISEGEYGVLASERTYDASLPLSPEQAAAFAVGRTGRRVASLPVAIMVHPGNYGNRMPAKCMRWKIRLESPVRLRGQYGEYETSDVYVRRERYCSGRLLLQVADREQPDSGSIEYPVFSGREVGGREATQSVKVRFTLPLVFDSVTVVP